MHYGINKAVFSEFTQSIFPRTRDGGVEFFWCATTVDNVDIHPITRVQVDQNKYCQDPNDETSHGGGEWEMTSQSRYTGHLSVAYIWTVISYC